MKYIPQNLMHSQIFMHDDEKESNPVQLYLDESGIYHTRDEAGNIRMFELIKPFDEIERDHKEEIMNYNGLPLLGELNMVDIFMHFGYVKEILEQEPNLIYNILNMKDKFNQPLVKGDTVLVPSPNGTDDNHHNEFMGHVEDFRGEYVTVMDGAGDCFDIEPRRLVKDNESEIMVDDIDDSITARIWMEGTSNEKYQGVDIKEEKWGSLCDKGILENTQADKATDWVLAGRVGFWEKYSLKMYSPSLDVLRHTNFSEFYGGGIVD